MKSKVKIKKRPRIALRRLEKIAKSFKGPDLVKVGLPRGSNAYPDGTSVIMVGAVHEFGSPVKGIPQRSFLRSTVEGERRVYKNMFKKLSVQIIKGQITKKQALGIIGLKVQTDVRQKITDIKEPPLQYREGNPLVDTGHLRQSIVFEVED